MKKAFLLSLMILFFFSNCKKEETNIAPNCFEKPSCGLVDGSFLISKSQDAQLGAQVAAQIAADPTTYPILDSAKYPDAYAYLNNLKNDILNTGNVSNKDAFVWKLKIINDDKTLNAFCTPGGYIYFYTGLLKYLKTKDAVAGVMGHEIAHADQRHSTQSMITQYGTSFLLDIIGGNTSRLAQLVTNLSLLKYSRCHESEADYYSVNYLSGTNRKYFCDGASEFFKQLSAEGAPSSPEFLSTHPSPDNRVDNITKAAGCASCNRSGTAGTDSEYISFLSKLP